MARRTPVLDTLVGLVCGALLAACGGPADPSTTAPVPDLVPAPAGSTAPPATTDSTPPQPAPSAASVPPTPSVVFEFDEADVRIARYLDGDDIEPPTIDEWVRWLALDDVDVDRFEATRSRLRLVPTPVVGAVIEASIGFETDNPHVLQLLWEPFLRMSGTSLDELAGAFRSELGLAQRDSTWRPTRCTSDQFEHAHAHHHLVSSPERDPIDPEAVIAAVVASGGAGAPEPIRDAIELMSSLGGTIVFDPSALRSDAVLAMRQGADLVVGDRWIEAAAEDPLDVHSNLAHELGGHLFYGRPLGCLIVLHAVDRPDDIPGIESFSDLRRTFGYAETEVYAELKELPHHGAGLPRDDPRVDVPDRLDAIVAAFPPDIAIVVLDWMRYRFELDATLSDDAKRFFAAELAALAPPVS